MLYITRKKGESIVINNNIEITIVEVLGNKVKLGCSFPEDATILRSELYDKVKENNAESIGAFSKIKDLNLKM